MMLRKLSTRRFWMGVALLGTGTVVQFGFLEGCDSRLLSLTQFVDPCGTILNCAPGSFQAARAELNDPCFDPTCTIPGGCDNDGPALGSTRDLCD